MKILLGLALAAFTASPAWCGDLVITKKKHSDAASMMGQETPAKDSLEVTWLGKDRLRVEEGDQITIVRADLKKMYMLDAKSKTYSAVDLPMDLKKYLPPEMAPMMDQMLGQMKVTVTPTTETKKVKEWDATKTTMTMSMMGSTSTRDLWVAKDVGVDLTGMKDMYASLLSASPVGASMAAEMMKIDGLPVLIEFTQKMAGSEMKSTEEVVSLETKEPAADLYELPKDYTEKPFDPLAEMKMGGGGGRGPRPR